MEKKCYKCGSLNVAKVVSASSACVPEIKKDIMEGRAVINCCCAGTGSTGLYRCNDCNFEWDYYYERAMKQEIVISSKDKINIENKVIKKKWWKF